MLQLSGMQSYRQLLFFSMYIFFFQGIVKIKQKWSQFWILVPGPQFLAKYEFFFFVLIENGPHPNKIYFRCNPFIGSFFPISFYILDMVQKLNRIPEM